MASPERTAAKFSARALISPMTAGSLLPGIANGFYRLIDRHSDAGDGQNLLERASLNVTLAVYDADSDTLYFCEGYLTTSRWANEGRRRSNPSAGADALIDPQPRCPVTAGGTAAGRALNEPHPLKNTGGSHEKTYNPLYPFPDSAADRLRRGTSCGRHR